MRAYNPISAYLDAFGSTADQPRVRAMTSS
jgi:hypothetical protein